MEFTFNVDLLPGDKNLCTTTNRTSSNPLKYKKRWFILTFFLQAGNTLDYWSQHVNYAASANLSDLSRDHETLLSNVVIMRCRNCYLMGRSWDVKTQNIKNPAYNYNGSQNHRSVRLHKIEPTCYVTSHMQFQLHTKILHYAWVMEQTIMITFQMRFALFWFITKFMVVIPYWHFGTTNGPNMFDPWRCNQQAVPKYQ